MSRLAIAAVKRGPQQLELGHLMSAYLESALHGMKVWA